MTTKWGDRPGSPRTGLSPWGKRRISGFGVDLKPPPIQRISRPRLGQRDPQQNPTHEVAGNALDALGEPLSIREVAQIIGCSTWAIRQKYIPQGLPCLRSGPAGKLIFYRHQVVRWILQQQNKQQKGGR
jgi:hypothetical protein